VGPASARTEGGEAARGDDFVLVDGDGRAEMATTWVRSRCGQSWRQERAQSAFKPLHEVKIAALNGTWRAPSRSNQRGHEAATRLRSLSSASPGTQAVPLLRVPPRRDRRR